MNKHNNKLFFSNYRNSVKITKIPEENGKKNLKFITITQKETINLTNIRYTVTLQDFFLT